MKELGVGDVARIKRGSFEGQVVKVQKVRTLKCVVVPINGWRRSSMIRCSNYTPFSFWTDELEPVYPIHGA